MNRSELADASCWGQPYSSPSATRYSFWRFLGYRPNGWGMQHQQPPAAIDARATSNHLSQKHYGHVLPCITSFCAAATPTKSFFNTSSCIIFFVAMNASSRCTPAWRSTVPPPLAERSYDHHVTPRLTIIVRGSIQHLRNRFLI